MIPDWLYYSAVGSGAVLAVAALILGYWAGKQSKARIIIDKSGQVRSASTDGNLEIVRE
jgi:protein-S-isoprenylcysteine O-methyltransferase Ste14